ncbi:5-carboxymethyl-2-hydroxymuconate Delta-isomerase [Thalassobacillus sp. CUG 92003]|uniref:5-carboxymethyl-2-hydroxymuconate Delta-isomerase n=1 Tax=Thalassobacillus sp. CUG 92003 TaxID=2736641 RepID=UPI0015E6D1DE
MPHVIIEYTDNLENHTDIQHLLKKINDMLMTKSETFPVGGIRSRAHKVSHYQIADGAENDAFVHAELKIGKGRSEAEKQNACDQLFAVINDHFETYASDHYVALSLELTEFQHATYKSNNIHKRFK